MSKELKQRALRLVLNCVRDTYLETLHRGKDPDSKTGDFSDVKVVTPSCEIPWNKLGRFSNHEMKKLMIEVVNKTYTYLLLEKDLTKNFSFRTPTKWNEPELDKKFQEMAAVNEDSGHDPISVLDKAISEWLEYSSNSGILECFKFLQGILTGLRAAGAISEYENQTVWTPKILKRKDTLLALRAAVKKKALKAKDKIDVQEIESGLWVGIDHNGKAQTRIDFWDSLQYYRDRFTLVPACIAEEK